MKNGLTLLYMACFAACGWPGVVRIVRRRSSGDLSVWREWLLIAGLAAQFSVMLITGADWRIWISPINTFCSVATTLVAIYRYR